MNEPESFVKENIIQDMSEGVLTLDFSGIINYINPACLNILEKDRSELLGKSFASRFFEYEENDSFNQIVLDAIYDRQKTINSIVPFYTGQKNKFLRITSSALHINGRIKGIVLVLDDISELMQLRDAVTAMKKIEALNDKLELRNKLLNETFGRFLSDEIVKQLLDTPGGLKLGGQKQTLSVLMSDLRGFTAMSETIPAQDLLETLNHYLSKMIAIIQENNGTIIEFLGDGILAVFGAPTPSKAHACDAVAAAVKMQAAMEEVNEWNKICGFPELKMGIGIASGEVIVGNIGSEKRTKYGVIGKQVNLCGRIESYTVGGQIFISPETYNLIDVPLDVALDMEVLPKGMQKPIILRQVTGIGGNYNASYKIEEDIPKKLEEPVHITFSKINDKHEELKQNDAEIAALCTSGAVIYTDTQVNIYDNLKLNIQKGIFCKVTNISGKDITIRFTSVTEGFDALSASLIDRELREDGFI